MSKIRESVNNIHDRLVSAVDGLIASTIICAELEKELYETVAELDKLEKLYAEQYEKEAIADSKTDNEPADF